MASRFASGLLVLAFAALASACVVRTGPPVGGTVVAGGGVPATFSVLNQSPYTICFVQMSQGGDWGGDWLGSSETVPPGNQRDFSLTAGTWNIQFLDCNRQPIFRRYNVPIQGAITLTFRVYEVAQGITPTQYATLDRRRSL
ncbi:MAG: hypothetical protein IT379_20985 [Deltaproteobacteria bacterium]|nr:hypothetical protein [Deltaproteobacteria bacterium]